MAAKTTVPADRPSLKPSRSMTYPLREPKGNAPKRRVKQGEPFDPEDLSRRLNAHIVEQKIRAEKRREARAAKAAASAAYHHVPKVAASAFARTTTPDVMRHVPKIAQPAIKSHLELLALEAPVPGTQLTTLQKTQAMDKALLEREMLRNRNQFQWNHDLQEAAESDLDRGIYKVPQRTFNSDFAHLTSRHKKGGPRPSSTGDMFWDDEETQNPEKPKTAKPPAHDVNDRNDWVQRDEEEKNRQKEKSSPFLKKMESSWGLMGRKERWSKQERRDEGIAGIGVSPPDGSKSVKGSFLARFKRHPS